MTRPTPARSLERRGEPRVPVLIPAWIGDGHARSSGQVVDASVRGLLVELGEPPLFAGRDVTVTLALPRSGLRELAGTVVRRQCRDDGRVALAVRLAAPLTLAAADAPGRRPAVPCGSGSRPRAVAAAELCELGTGALELTASGQAAPVPRPVAQWLEHLSAELGGPSAPAPRTARDLIDAVAAVAARR
ncbi:MAG TPA: PilZ domain-containing protein [Miltoncostaeaceae bacterium]|nr:PilZ domain-containing protein [Miltoncostaeaceae bacterium]